MVCAALATSVFAQLPKLHVEGKNLVDPSGKVITLKGVNAGNWHVIEFWMLGLSGVPGNPPDQFGLEELLTKRFGEAEKDRLMDVYHASWITERDFSLMPSFGFNLVRLPMNYRMMEDDRNPYRLKKDAWKWIDRAVSLSEKNGMYIILDMHGAQGGQSPYDHTGHSDQNHLKDSPDDQKRLAWLWGEIAKRYRDRNAVVAYDTFNEPYGMPKDAQVKTFRQCYDSIRKVDPDKLIFAHGHYDNFDHYGDPKANGWRNVGFQMHFYPGLFGNGSPNLKTQARHLNSLDGWGKKVSALNVPFLVGEMNVVFDSAGGAEMMRRTFEKHAAMGWMTTMWAWKVTSDEGGIGDACWGCSVNAKPRKPVHFATDSKEQIEAYFRGFATEELALNTKLRDQLNGSAGPLPPMPEIPAGRTVAPDQPISGWMARDIGNPLKGGQEVLSDGTIALYGGGSDIWGGSDQFRFLSQPLSGDGELSVEVVKVEDLEAYTKAGLMLRASDKGDSPTVTLTVFPDGTVQFGHRDKAGADIDALPTVEVDPNGLRLRLVRKGGKIVASYAPAGADWKDLGTIEDKLPIEVRAGAIALSHDNNQLVQIIYRGLALKH